MSFDDLVISFQHAIDRAIRRVRRGAPPTRAQRRFLVVQIDGLSRVVLEQAMATGHMPFVKHLLKLQRMIVDRTGTDNR